jgi:hypothetical protein
MHVGKNNEHALYISADLSCPFSAWRLWASSLKGILGLFQTCLEVSGACCHGSPFASHSAGSINFVAM